MTKLIHFARRSQYAMEKWSLELVFIFPVLVEKKMNIFFFLYLNIDNGPMEDLAFSLWVLCLFFGFTFTLNIFHSSVLPYIDMDDSVNQVDFI